MLDAQAALRQTLLESGTEEEFLAWHEQLPDNPDEQPDIWFVRGLRFARLEQMDAAVRCFGEALRRDPNHAAANYQLFSALAAIGKADQAEAFAARSRQLARMPLLIDEIINTDRILEAVNLLRDLGRLWEAADAMARLDWNRDERPGDLKFYQKI